MDEEAQRAAARARQLQAEAEEERLAAEEAEKAEKQVGGPVFMTQQEASDFSARCGSQQVWICSNEHALEIRRLLSSLARPSSPGSPRPTKQGMRP